MFRTRDLFGRARAEMSEHEEQQTDRKKQGKSKQGDQLVANTGRPRRARKDVTEDQGNDKARVQDQQPKTGQKRTRGKKDEGEKEEGSNKQQKTKGGTSKTIGSKHMKADAPAKQATLDRLPKKGQQAHWKAMPGWVDGKVVEVLKKGKTVAGKQVKASQDDPKIILESNSSGKICVHTVRNVYFD